MKLPNATEAIIELPKLESYCLSPDHPRGKHKAKVFLSVLGLERKDVSEFSDKIRAAILVEDCERGKHDMYRVRYTIDFVWDRQGKSARIRTTWIVKTGETSPRLTTSYVL